MSNICKIESVKHKAGGALVRNVMEHFYAGEPKPCAKNVLTMYLKDYEHPEVCLAIFY